MKIQCPSCQLEGNVPDEKVPEGGGTIRCPKCKNKIRVSKEPPVEFAFIETPSTQFTCPKCEKEQEELDACIYCGIFYSKYKLRLEAEKLAAERLEDERQEAKRIDDITKKELKESLNPEIKSRLLEKEQVFEIVENEEHGKKPIIPNINAVLTNYRLILYFNTKKSGYEQLFVPIHSIYKSKFVNKGELLINVKNITNGDLVFIISSLDLPAIETNKRIKKFIDTVIQGEMGSDWYNDYEDFINSDPTLSKADRAFAKERLKSFSGESSEPYSKAKRNILRENKEIEVIDDIGCTTSKRHLVLDKDNLYAGYEGVQSGNFFGSKVKRYLLEAITSTDIKRTAISLELEIVMPGSIDTALITSYVKRATNENIFVFPKQRENELVRFVSNLNNAMEAKKRSLYNNSSVETSIPEQIKQLAELKDLGILSSDEFEEKKKVLLKRI